MNNSTLWHCNILDQCLDNEELSFETIEFQDGKDWALYEGSTKAGVPWDIGILSMKNGDKYIGCFENDLYNGFGKLRYSNDDESNRTIYIGKFKNGNRQGVGRLKWKSGAVFDRKYFNDARNGFG